MLQFTRHCGALKLSRIKSLTAAVKYLDKHPLQKWNAETIAAKFKFTERQSAKMVGMSLRLYKLAAPSAVLQLPAIENIVRLSELYHLGLTTFDRKPKSFIKWLNTDVPSLHNLKPIEILYSGIGIQIIRNELLRMEHSIT